MIAIAFRGATLFGDVLFFLAGLAISPGIAAGSTPSSVVMRPRR